MNIILSPLKTQKVITCGEFISLGFYLACVCFLRKIKEVVNYYEDIMSLIGFLSETYIKK